MRMLLPLSCDVWWWWLKFQLRQGSLPKMISHFMSAQQRVTSKESMTIPAFPITVIRQRSNFPNLHASCQYSEETGIVAGGRHTKTHPWTRHSQVSPVFTSVPLALCPYLPSISAAHPRPASLSHSTNWHILILTGILREYRLLYHTDRSFRTDSLRWIFGYIHMTCVHLN